MKRNIGIDIIKFIAALMITNSHMGSFYPETLSFLATGGAIGDALFFFCSGFTLFLKPMGRFDNWYKRRISRIFPTAFTWALLSVLVIGHDMSVISVLKWSGGWFVKCIMIYYFVLFIIDRFARNHLKSIFIAMIAIIIVSYSLWNKSDNFSMFGDTYFKWVLFFIYMLFGAIVGTGKIHVISGCRSIILFIISVLSFYGIFFVSQRYEILNNIQIISMFALLGVVYSMYSLFNCNKSKEIFRNNIIHWIVMFIGGMCLEIYIVQGNLLQQINFELSFPINYIVAFAIIIFSAYILKCSTRLLSQTFSEKQYNWSEILKVI